MKSLFGVQERDQRGEDGVADTWVKAEVKHWERGMAGEGERDVGGSRGWSFGSDCGRVQGVRVAVLHTVGALELN